MKALTGCAGGIGAVFVLAVALACASAASCASAEVASSAPRRPPLPEDCPVQLFPTTKPSYPAVDLTSVRAVCNRALGRAACLKKLRVQTCAAGGDTAYGFKEGINPDGAGMFISATVAARGEASSVPAGAAATTVAPPAGDSAPGCAPICSPGFACQAGQCIPECNPACEPTEICNRHRTCEPAPAAPATTK
jgi:hypothetical protein